MSIRLNRGRQVLPTSESGNVKADPNMYAGEYEAARQIADTAQRGVTDVYQTLHKAEVDREYTEFESQVNTARMEQYEYMLNNNDNLTGEDAHGNPITDYTTSWDQRMKGLSDVAGKLKTKQARTSALNYLNVNGPNWRKSEILPFVNRERMARSGATGEFAIEQAATALFTTEVDGINKEKRKAGLPDVSEDEYRVAKMNEIAQGLVDKNIWSEEKARSEVGRGIELIEKAQEEAAKQQIDAELATARGIYDQTQDKVQALDYIRNSEVVPEDEKQELQSDLNSEIAYREGVEAEQQTQLEIQTERDLQVKAFNNELTVSEIRERVDDGSLPPEKGRVLSNLINTKSNIVTPFELQTKSEGLIRDVRLGKITRDKATEELSKLAGNMNSTDVKAYGKRIFDEAEKLEDPENIFNDRRVRQADAFLSKMLKSDNTKAWFKIQNDFDKWYQEYHDKNGKKPESKEVEEFVRVITSGVLRDALRNDWPDAETEQILRDLPFETRVEYANWFEENEDEGWTGASTTKWIKKWRKKKKPLTKDVAKHYLNVTNGNRQEAIRLAKQDGYGD